MNIIMLRPSSLGCLSMTALPTNASAKRLWTSRPKAGMRHFTAAEPDAHLELVALLQELSSLIHPWC